MAFIFFSSISELLKQIITDKTSTDKKFECGTLYSIRNYLSLLARTELTWTMPFNIVILFNYPNMPCNTECYIGSNKS